MVRHMPIVSTRHSNPLLVLGVAIGEIDVDLRDDRAWLRLSLSLPSKTLAPKYDELASKLKKESGITMYDE